MNPTDDLHRRTSQDTEWPSTSLTIDYIPDEVLLDIFDSYRKDIDPYDQWRKQHVWIYLTHVCRRWRAVIFASSSRLDLGITIGSKKPGHIKTILSGPLPIFMDFKYGIEDIGSARWRMLAVLKHHDRVREISFQGLGADFDKFFEETQCTFPILESLSLSFEFGYKPNITDTFLGGPDSYNLHLRRLKLEETTLASMSRFLLSATALTDLTLKIRIFFNLSEEMSLLACCLRGMPCLCSLDLSLSLSSLTYHSPLQSPTPKDIVTLSKLTRLYFNGSNEFLDFIVAGLSAPSLQDVHLNFSDIYDSTPPILYLPRFINEIKEPYHAVHVGWNGGYFLLLMLTREYVSQSMPRFHFRSLWTSCADSMIQIINTLSTRLSTIEELHVTFDGHDAGDWDFTPWHRFFLQFPNVKALRTEGRNNYTIGRVLVPDLEGPEDYFALFPALEEIELGKDDLRIHESQRRDQLAVFEPFVTARQQAGRTVKVFFSP